MKALILVGGFGTRLRPLTLTLPKPLVPFANKPMILHQIEALVNVGVTDIVLAVNYRPETMVAYMQEYKSKYNINITFSVESEPLGTAGPLALAREILSKDSDPFFVLNSDVICEFPFSKMIEFHRAHGKQGTILATKIDEPSKYGVIVTSKGSTRIECFVEKPKKFVSNRINAGIYLLSPPILNRIELRPTSIEKEVFPCMALDNELHAMDLDGFWMDVGQPKDYITGTGLYLSTIRELFFKKVDQYVVDPVLLHPTSIIGKNCRIGPNVVIGPDVYISDGVRIFNSIVFEGSTVNSNAFISNSIIGWNSKIGSWTRIEGNSVLGNDVVVSDEVYVNGGSILPNKEITTNIPEPKIIM